MGRLSAAGLPARQGQAGITPIRTYRNPIFLAREWAEAMETGDFRSQRAFSRAIGLPHARVSQVLGLLRLCSNTREALDALGDPLYSRKVTERKLRRKSKSSCSEKCFNYAPTHKPPLPATHLHAGDFDRMSG